MSDRALPHIEKIEWKKPIENADNIELIGVLGWVCIAKINEFQVGDKCVYIEIDSLAPKDDERFAFLESKKYKIKTMKLGKKFGSPISQGLALPLTEFPEIADKDIGTDVTETLKITYYSADDRQRKGKGIDPDAKYKSMSTRHPKLAKKKWWRWLIKRTWGKKLLFLFFGKKKDNPKGFPEWIVKTDETRCLFRDTKIETNKGRMRIADIVNKKLDVKVLSYNEKTGKVEYKKILNYQKFPFEESWYKITYPINKYGNKTNTIKCTRDHKFFNGNKYIKAEDLKIGDTIYTLSNSYSNQDLKDILGMIIGDSHIAIDKRKNNDNSSSKELTFTIVHGEKQLEYLKEKVRLLNGDISKIRTIKSGYCNNNVYNYTVNIDHNLTNMLYDFGCIKDNKFHITKKFCDNLSEAALAYWYLDDGCIRNNHVDSIQKPSIQISTNSETDNEIYLLIDMLKNRFGIDCNYRKDKKYGSIYVTVEGTRKFLNIITKYIPNCMRYKTLIELQNIDYEYNNYVFRKSEILLETTIKNIEEIPYKKSVFSNGALSFDLEIEDNHNFFANRILTHNCENIPWVLESKEKWIQTEKLDGTSCTYAINKIKKNKYEFIVCSRNVRQADKDQETYHFEGHKPETNIYWELADKYDIENKLIKFAQDNNYDRVVLQGEGVGSVQGNPYKLDENKLYCFNLVINGQRKGTMALKEWCDDNNMLCVPIIDTRHELPHNMESMKLEADGYSTINPKVKREGFVYRNQDGTNSFKNVSREYLLKHNG